MKTLFTIVVCGKADDGGSAPLYDGIEIIYSENGETAQDFLARALKNAKGKYTVICDHGFRFADVQSVLNIIDKNTADMVCFSGGSAIKTAVMKNCVKDCTGIFSCKLLSVLNCKNLLKTVYTPFYFAGKTETFTDKSAEELLMCAEAFGSVKAKLPKEIYSYAFNMLCDILIQYYMYAMLAIKDGDMPADRLISFDSKLKAEIVLYLALEKRFTVAKLNKLKDKNFKISFITAKKFRKLIN